MGEIKVNLTNEEFVKLIEKNKKVGEGTEGYVIKKGKEVYKIYKDTKEYTVFPKTASTQVDQDGVRLYDKSEYSNKQGVTRDNRLIKYTDSDETKLSSSEALERVVERGTKVTGSRLPSKIILVDGIVRGCVYPYYGFCTSIYNSMRHSFKSRINTCKKLIEKVKELIANNVYPVDLCQKNVANPYDKNFSNVFLNIKGEPIIIDLDGKSTLYTELYNPNYERLSCVTLSTLILEIMCRADLQAMVAEEDMDSVYEVLGEIGLDDEQINKYINMQIMTDDIDNIMESIESRRRTR